MRRDPTTPSITQGAVTCCARPLEAMRVLAPPAGGDHGSPITRALLATLFAGLIARFRLGMHDEAGILVAASRRRSSLSTTS